MIFEQTIFQLLPPGETSHHVSVLSVLGDGSGLFDVAPNQTFYIEYTAAVNRRSHPPVNFNVQQDGKLFLPADFRIVGDMDPPFFLDGLMVGVYNLTVGENREFRLGDHASNGHISNGSYDSPPEEGIYVMTS